MTAPLFQLEKVSSGEPVWCARLATTKWLSPEVLADPLVEKSLFPEEMSGGLVLSGKMPLWLPAGITATVVASLWQKSEEQRGWDWLGIFDPRQSGAIVVARRTTSAPALGTLVPLPVPNTPTPAGPLPAAQAPAFDLQPAHEVFSGFPQADHWVLTLREVPGETLDPRPLSQNLQQLELRLSSAEPCRLLILNGRLPLWLAAGIVAHLTQKRYPAALGIHHPPTGGFVVVRPDRSQQFLKGQLIGFSPSEIPPVFIGIIGDPNHGKSVLSWKLYWELCAAAEAAPSAETRHSLRAFRLDADAYSPTPGWSLNPLAKLLRDDYKRWRGPWSQEDLDNLQKAIGNLRRSSFKLVLLDLPGGDHSCQPPQRIPPGREFLFQAADGFLLMHRAEKPEASAGWRAELTRLGLMPRLLAEIESCSAACPGEVESWPEPVPEFAEARQSPPCWRIAYLDRSLVEQQTPASRHLAQTLWKWLPHLQASKNRG